MPLQFIKGHRNKDQLIYSGYIFRRDGEKDGTVYWRCAKHYIGCQGRVHTCLEEVVYYKDDHNHGKPNLVDIKMRRTLNNIRKEAGHCLQSTPHQVLSEAKVYRMAAPNPDEGSANISEDPRRNRNLDFIEDISTPVGEPLSGKYRRSFAHVTIKERLPVILTKVIDHFSRNKATIISIYGEDSISDIKYLIRFISRLKNELVTNKNLMPLRFHDYVSNHEAMEWNEYLVLRKDIQDEIPTWFNTTWLYCECYMYRILAQEISLTINLSRYDPFEDDKQASFLDSYNNVIVLGSYVKNLLCNKKTDDNLSKPQLKEEFKKLLNICLWGNRSDLSLFTRGSNSSSSPQILESSEENIIVNDWEYVWRILTKQDQSKYIIDIVLDNAGYELFTDLCLAAFLSVYADTQISTIRFYVKKYPWYVSDATLHDFYWILERMENPDNNSSDLQHLAKLYFDFMDNGTWSLEEEPFWTSPYNFTEMKEKYPNLYAKLSNAKLVIFKGDLNYRKLLGDINFEYTTNFTMALGNFNPTNIVSLRTVKSDICVGLTDGIAESLFEKDKHWMITGKYGLIQANTFTP